MADSLRILLSVNRWPRWRRVLAGLCLVPLLGAGGYLVFSRKVAAGAANGQSEGEWLEVQRRNFKERHIDEGELRPVKVTALSFLRRGKVSWLIPEGSPVKKGDKLCSLETRDLDDQLRNLEQDLAAAEKNLTQQQQTRELEVKRLEAELRGEKDRVELARLREKELLAHPTELDKEEAKAKREGAGARLQGAEGAFAAFKPLSDKGFGTASELEMKRVAVEKAQVEMQRAEAKYEQALAGAKPEERRKSALERESAELGLHVKELEHDKQLADLLSKVQAAQREVEHTQRKIERTRQDLEKSTIVAPHEGIVVHRPVNWHSQKKIEVGENVGPWASPLELPSLETMKVRTQVPESFVRRVWTRAAGESDGQGPRSGSKALVKVASLKEDRWYAAEVVWIDGWARDRNSKLSDADIKAQGLSGVQVFDVEVELLEKDTARLREGFRATVEFPVKEISNVIVIPIDAVTLREGVPFVQVQKDNGREWRKIETAEQCMGEIVVSAGLDAGEKILMPRKLKQEEEDRKEEQAQSEDSDKRQKGDGAQADQPKRPRFESREDGNRTPDGPRRMGGQSKGGGQ